MRFPHRLPRPASLVLAALLFVGCGDSVGLGEVLELNAAKERWQRNGSQDYSFVLGVSCFCVSTNPLRVTVRGDTVQSIEVLGPLEQVPPGYQPHAPTIRGLFDVIREAMNRDKADLKVSYDPVYGFPRAFMVDWDGVMGNDDEVAYSVSELQFAHVP